MSVVHIVAKNTVAQGASRVVSIISSIVLTIVLTRSLGKTSFGEYTFITSLVLLFGTVSDWGTNIITVKAASIEPNKSKNLFANAIVGRFLLAVGAFILFNIAIRVNPAWSVMSSTATVGALVLLVISLKTSVSMVFHVFQRLELTSFIDLIGSLFFALFVFLIISKGSSVTTVMFLWFITTLLSAVLGILLVRKLFDFREIFTVNFKSLSDFFRMKFLKDALPAGFLLILSTIYNRIDILILHHYKGSEAVAAYGLPYKVYDQTIMVSAFLMTSLFPILARSFAENRYGKKLQEYYQRSFDALLVLGIIASLGLFFLSPYIVMFLGGAEYQDSVQVMRLLSLVVVPSFFNHLTGYSLLAFGKQKLALAIAILALTVNVLLNLLMVPTYSFYGSAIITLVTEVLVFVLSTIAIFRVINFLPKMTSFPATLGQINRLYSAFIQPIK